MKIKIFAIATLFFTVIFISCKQHESDQIRIACNLPMTGNFSLYGESIRDGILMAAEDLKDSCSVYNINIKYDFQDNTGDSKSAVTIYRKQELSGYDVYVSGITQQTASIIPMQSLSKKPHFIWSYVPLILSAKDNLYRTWVDYPQEAKYFLKYLDNNDKFKRIACVYPNAESAQTLFNELFIPNLSKGIDVVYNESFDTSTSDFKNIILKIKSTNPDVIFINGWDNHLALLIKELDVNNMKKNGNLMFTFDLMDAQNKISSQLMEGLIANLPASEVYVSEKRKIWEERFEKIYNKKPNYTNAYAYDFACIMFNVAKNNRGINKKTLESLGNNIQGVTGMLKISSDGMLLGEYTTCIYQNGKFVPLNDVK